MNLSNVGNKVTLSSSWNSSFTILLDAWRSPEDERPPIKHLQIIPFYSAYFYCAKSQPPGTEQKHSSSLVVFYLN